MIRRARIRFAFAAFVTGSAALLQAQLPQRLDEALQRVFQRNEYASEVFGPTAWLDGGRKYTSLSGATHDLVAYDTATGQSSVLVATKDLVPAGAKAPLEIDAYDWSSDQSKLLIFTNTRRVWRQNTRGDYWVFDVNAQTLERLGGHAPEASLMFAKFSPDGQRVAYVRAQNIYVERLAGGAITPLTKDGRGDIINGTSDWVNEEELDIRDGFRWSPDGRRIAYWQFNTTGVERFTLINDTDALYPKLTQFPYPKTGTKNSAVRVGIVSADGGATRWVQAPGDPRDHYIARLEWVEAATVALQQLNRHQNTLDMLLADAATGSVRRAFRDQSDSWVDVPDEVVWFNQNREFTWTSEKDGWRHVYAVSRDGAERLLTKFDGDVAAIAAVDTAHGRLYFTASPTNATERYLYSAPLDGAGSIERVTPQDLPGTHGYDIAPDGNWAIHSHSRFDTPARTDIVSLPDHKVARVVAENASLRSKAGSIVDPPVEFLTVDVGGGVSLDGYLLKPKSFDPARKYPVIVYTYGEPAATTVNDRWAGASALFQRALAEEGYLVASFDNRGTPSLKGTKWRKVIYGSVGDLSSKEQAAAIRRLGQDRRYIDFDRIAIYGASGGGSNTLNAMFRFPDVYKVGVSIAPVPDQRLYDTIYQERYMGLPQTNEKGYLTGSSIHFAEGLRGRLLVIHGTGDDNVHFQGTERLINRLVELGKPFDVMLYPNRTHALSEGPGTRLHLYRLVARYLLEHLAAGPRPQ